jgi:hypothetical protein
MQSPESPERKITSPGSTVITSPVLARARMVSRAFTGSELAQGITPPSTIQLKSGLRRGQKNRDVGKTLM